MKQKKEKMFIFFHALGDSFDYISMHPPGVYILVLLINPECAVCIYRVNVKYLTLSPSLCY